MKQAFIEENYLDIEVEIDIGGRTLYKGVVTECNDGVLSLRWGTKEEGYTHIDIEKIAAIWRTLKK